MAKIYTVKSTVWSAVKGGGPPVFLTPDTPSSHIAAQLTKARIKELVDAGIVTESSDGQPEPEEETEEVVETEPATPRSGGRRSTKE